MARTRKGAAQYPAQLRRMLAGPADAPSVFSAATLAEERFELKPREHLRTTLNKLHHALRAEWEAGAVVAFVAVDGTVLREKKFCVNGTAAVAHPQIFGLPGTESPEAGYTPMTYEEFLRTKAAGAGHDDDEAKTSDELPEKDLASTDQDEPEALDEDEPESALAVEEALAAAAKFKIQGAAPDWIPDRVLIHIVSLPIVVAVWRSGLDRAKGGEKLQLIRAGVRRKGSFDALTAQKVAEFCRREQDWWDRAYWSAVEQYKEWDDWIDDDDLPALAAGADEFLIEHEGRYHPVAIALCGIMLDAGADSLAFVASAAEDVLDEEEGQQTVSVQEELRRRVSTLEAEAAELRKQLDEQEDEAKAQEQRAEDFSAELERLRKAQGAASATDKQLADAERRAQDLSAENASLKTRLARVEARAKELEELRVHLVEHEHEHDELAVRAASAENERMLREQTEARLQEQIAETRRLERELRDTGAIRVSVEDGGTLIRALAKPIGEAAEHAARRLAAGEPLADDPGLLEFAGAFGKLAASTAPAPAGGPAAAAGPDPTPAAAAVETRAAEQPAEPAAVSPVPAADEAAPMDHEPVAEEPTPPQPPRRRSRRTAIFTVHPAGGGGEVGGSAIVVQTRSGDTVLLDAGQRVKGEYGIDTLSPFHHSLPSFEHLDAIVVSHAHIDHIGSLPILYREYQRDREDRLPILMSEPTKRVGEIMMRDSARIQHKNQYLVGGAFAELALSDFANELDLKPAYEDADITEALEAVQICEPRQPRVIPGTSITVKLLPVAHVLGSCAVHLTDNESGKTLLYTGDLGPLTDTQRTLPDFDGVNGFDPADVVIMESTYALVSENERGGRRDPTREDSLATFYRAAQKARDAGGHVLLPAFSLGRTQELLRVIEDATATGDLPEGDVYIGGMGERITEIYTDYKGSPWVAPGTMRRASEMNRWLRDATSFDEIVEEAITRESFSYIIVSPAMLSGGWSRKFLERMVGEERHAIVFTGYLPRHGGAIRNLSQLHTGAAITLGETTGKIRCEWRKATLSAHAPLHDLRAFAQRMLLGNREVAFGIVHGLLQAQESLASELNELDGASATSLSNGIPWKPAIG